MKTTKIDGSEVLPGDMYMYYEGNDLYACKFVICSEQKQSKYTVTRLGSRDVYALDFRIGSKSNFDVVDDVAHLIREESK